MNHAEFGSEITPHFNPFEKIEEFNEHYANMLGQHVATITARYAAKFVNNPEKTLTFDIGYAKDMYGNPQMMTCTVIGCDPVIFSGVKTTTPLLQVVSIAEVDAELGEPQEGKITTSYKNNHLGRCSQSTTIRAMFLEEFYTNELSSLMEDRKKCVKLLTRDDDYDIRFSGLFSDTKLSSHNYDILKKSRHLAVFSNKKSALKLARMSALLTPKQKKSKSINLLALAVEKSNISKQFIFKNDKAHKVWTAVEDEATADKIKNYLMAHFPDSKFKYRDRNTQKFYIVTNYA